MRRLVTLAVGACALWLSAPASAAVAPVRWCGADAVSADRLSDRAGGPQVHVIYATPADGDDRFASLASALATDVAAIEAWWRTQDPERAPRFDLFDFPGCDSRFGRLDLSFARLPQPAAAYAQPNQFELVATALAAAPFGFADARKKYLVFYDGVGRPDDDDVCGTASGSPTRGGRFSYAIVFLRAGCTTGVGGGGANALVAAHELLHMLGALPAGAPHACPDDDGHPCDDRRDILWPFLQVSSLDSVLLDVNHDDYYGHPGPWFDVQDSAWLLLALRQAPLTLAPSGGGVIASDSGQSCSAACTSEWNTGSEVPLRAVPSPGWLFRGWRGGCSGGSGTCTASVGGPTTVSASFRRARTLTVAVSGRGVVGGTILCPRTCRRTVAEGDALALRATAARGWRFVRWAGPCRGSRATCRFAVRGSTTVRATFARRA